MCVYKFVYVPQEYAYTSVGTDTYEAVTTYEAGGHQVECSPRKRVSSTRQLRLNTDSMTDLSMDCYNYSDEDGDITHSCSDTEASFFIPQELHRRDHSKVNDSPYVDINGPIKDVPVTTSTTNDDRFQQQLQKVVEKDSNEDKDKLWSSLRHLYHVAECSSNCDKKPLSAERLRRISSRSSMSQDSLENQFEHTLRMISQGASCNLDSDNVSVSAFD